MQTDPNPIPRSSPVLDGNNLSRRADRRNNRRGINNKKFFICLQYLKFITKVRRDIMSVNDLKNDR